MTDQEQLREQLRANVTLENIANYGNAFVAHANAKRGKKHYGQVKAFEADLKPNLDALVSEIAHGTYHTGEYRIDIISDGPKQRIVGKVPYRDAEWFLNSRLYLEVKENWQVFEVAKRGIDFVGYRIWNNRTILRKSTFANMRVKCRNVWEQVHHAGILTDHARCVIMSYLGWVSKCSPHARRTIYDNYFARIISASGVKLTKTMRRNYKL